MSHQFNIIYYLLGILFYFIFSNRGISYIYTEELEYSYCLKMNAKVYTVSGLHFPEYHQTHDDTDNTCNNTMPYLCVCVF